MALCALLDYPAGASDVEAQFLLKAVGFASTFDIVQLDTDNPVPSFGRDPANFPRGVRQSKPRGQGARDDSYRGCPFTAWYAIRPWMVYIQTVPDLAIYVCAACLIIAIGIVPAFDVIQSRAFLPNLLGGRSCTNDTYQSQGDNT